ncbi:hypothetical protein BDN70DRAFT_886756 [Pholiota conissans]|uniref:C2H2-type domain-containing protein n=1 Tax=Pholiota conissans TaxID=109636 RepID=A0A9P5YS49_9AGAR|nr:hypothetical protein BDN70DRAFT_886756 [Pholiota conissans]
MSQIPDDVEVIDLTGLSDSSSSGGEDDNGSMGRHEDDDSGSEHDSESSEIEITLNAETRAQLQTAIATVSEARLRGVLKALVETEVMFEALLTRELVTLKRGTADIVPRWESCANCDEEFDVNTLREQNECVFHPGDLNPSDASLIEWDAETYGPMDTLDNRHQYPENFNWSCCEKDGQATGCVRGEHRPAVARKRKRIEE